MKQNIQNQFLLTATIVLSAAWFGCGKTTVAPPPATSSPAPQMTSAPDGPPVVDPILSAWQQGDKASALKAFVQTDWTARPLFAPPSVLSLTEKQFAALPTAQQATDQTELMAKSKDLKELAAAAMQAGRDAAAKKDMAVARDYFVALQQCGEALDSGDTVLLIKLVGRAFKKQAETELGKLSP